MNIVTGDLLRLADKGEFDVIVHGANCFTTMGAGIAFAIREKWYQTYIEDCKTVRGDYNKLGCYTYTTIKNLTIINAYTQYGLNKHGQNDDIFEYVSFEMILQKLAYAYPKSRFGMPLVGCGLAGGNKERVLQLMLNFSEKISKTGGTVTVVEFGGK
jgi:O-acetyl-ADP-ribose deacetylase (regulator of RNase III)